MFWEKVLASGVLLLCCCSALWRYKTQGVYYSIFSTRTSIHLDYYGDGFQEWEASPPCIFTNKNNKTTDMLCKSRGVYSIRPNNEAQDERFLYVDRSTDCFMWYFTSRTVAHTSIQAIETWIYDPENASPEEQSGKASSPSTNSRILTRQFSSMGQEPIFKSKVSHEVFKPEYKEEGIWEVLIPSVKNNIFVTIKGNSVALQDCFIADITFLLSSSNMTFSQKSHYVTMTTQNENILLFDWPPCFPATIATVSHWETLFTKNGFNNTERIRIPPNILTDEERKNIQEVCVIEEGIVLLTAGFVYLRTENDFIKLDKKFGIPPNIIGMKTRTYCWPDYTPEEGLELSEIVLWTENELIVGYTNNKFQSLVTIKKLQKILHVTTGIISQYSIHLATYTSDPTGIALMISYNTNSTLDTLYLVFYEEDRRRWSLQDFSHEYTHGKQLNALFIFSALPNFLIWDDTQVYYSYQNFSKNGYMTVDSEEKRTIFDENSSINQVFIDYYGNGVIRLRDNKIFYFKVGITEALSLHQWARKNDSTLFFVNPTGELFLAYLNFGEAQISEYPLTLELYSSSYEKQTQCPYLSFESSITYTNFNLDKGKELTFWVMITYPENFGLYTIVEMCGKKVLREKRYTEYEMASGISSKNMTVTYYQTTNYEGRNDYYTIQKQNTGHLMIQLRPSQFATMCPLSNFVIHVFVGCFSGRHLEVKGYKENMCQYENSSYIIEKQYLSGDPPEDKIVYYNVTQYGCPFKLHMLNKFQPILLLYDGPKLVEEVEANFVIWEIYGRKDFGYTLTMKEAGCVNEAQTWMSMKAKHKNHSIEEVWGPHNYRHCFSFALGKPGELSQPYEILNLTNKNEIVWDKSKVGFYVFRARIIDPNYSFCDLTVTFALEIYGVLPETDPQIIFLFVAGVALVIIVILIISYFQYLKFFRKFIYEPSLESKRKKQHQL